MAFASSFKEGFKKGFSDGIIILLFAAALWIILKFISKKQQEQGDPAPDKFFYFQRDILPLLAVFFILSMFGDTMFDRGEKAGKTAGEVKLLTTG